MHGGGDTEGAEGGDNAATAEAEQGEIARVGVEEAGGGEHIEDAVGGAWLPEDLGEDGAVLGEAPAAWGGSEACPDGGTPWAGLG